MQRVELCCLFYRNYHVAVYLACRNEHAYFHRFRCENEKLARGQCIHNYWNLPGLEERAYNEYLAARSHFRQTGDSNIVHTGSMMMQPKTWEEYLETKDETFWVALKKGFSELFSRSQSPDSSVPVDSKSLSDS